MTAYRRLFAPPRQDEMEYVPDPMGRLGMGTYVERPPRVADPGWEAARTDWMNGVPLKAIFGDEPFRLYGGVGREQQNRRADVFKLQALLHKEGHLDSEATGGPTGYWGNRDEDALRAFQEENGLTVDGYAEPDGETINTIRRFYDSPGQSMEKHVAEPLRVPSVRSEILPEAQDEGNQNAPAPARSLSLDIGTAAAEDMRTAEVALPAGQIATELAALLGLDPKTIDVEDPAVLKALGATTFYRYLHKRDRQKAMQSIEALKRDHPQLHGRLRATVADIVAHPQWHRDKMTPEELQSALDALNEGERDIGIWRRAVRPFLPKQARAVDRHFVKRAVKAITQDERRRLQQEIDRRRDPRDR